MTEDVISAIDVAAAAPHAPKPFHAVEIAVLPTPPKMKIGSKMRLSMFVKRDTLSGVTVFNNPR